MLNKYKNANNRRPYSKCYGYQNTKNASSSKNVLSKERNNKKMFTSKTGLSSAHPQTKQGIGVKSNNKNKSNKNSNISSHNNIKYFKENNYIKSNNILLNNNPSNKKLFIL